MREILFRGQTRRKGEKVNIIGKPLDGKWVYGGVFTGEGDFSIIYTRDPIRKYSVYSDTVGQYTGLTDKNGKKIFEGDIVRSIIDYDDIWGDSRTVVDVGTVIWNETNCDWSVENEIDTISLCEWDEGDFTVIGNIHDNPELLEREV